MNSLRVPITILAVIIVALIAWFVWAHQSAAPSSTSTDVATTTAPVQTQRQTNPTPTPDPATVAENIVGTWQSNNDPNYSVIVTADGKWTDLYKGSASSSASETGTYELFTTANPDKDFTGVLVPGVVYVKVAEGTSVLYFSVLEADGDNLQLSYLDRGTTLSFAKVQ